MTLWERVRRQSERALRSGALQPIPTEPELIEDGGVPFLVRVLAGRDLKSEAGERQRRTGADPFQPPYDPELLVGGVSETHVCLLNKFNAVPDHALVVTREREDQASPLGCADFAAVQPFLREAEALFFYNSDTVSGASQPHKHLQVVPVPLGAPPAATPIDAVLAEADLGPDPVRVPGLPFAHAVARLDPQAWQGDPEALLDLYRRLAEVVGLRPGGSYNLLATRGWAMLVPRARQSWRGVSVNALGFAGSLLVRDRGRLEELRRVGPMAALAAVAPRR